MVSCPPVSSAEKLLHCLQVFAEASWPSRALAAPALGEVWQESTACWQKGDLGGRTRLYILAADGSRDPVDATAVRQISRCDCLRRWNRRRAIRNGAARAQTSCTSLCIARTTCDLDRGIPTHLVSRNTFDRSVDRRRIVGIRCLPPAFDSDDANEQALDAAAGWCPVCAGPDGALDGVSAHVVEGMSELGVLRLITFFEGISYLVLLFVAMPLKYLFEMPMAVRITGGVHGLLFVSYALALYQARMDQHWSTFRTLQLLVVSLIPGSLFWLDGRIRTMGELK